MSRALLPLWAGAALFAVACGAAMPSQADFDAAIARLRVAAPVLCSAAGPSSRACDKLELDLGAAIMAVNAMRGAPDYDAAAQAAVARVAQVEADLAELRSGARDAGAHEDAGE